MVSNLCVHFEGPGSILVRELRLQKPFVRAGSRAGLCDPMDCSLPGSSLHGIFQSRTLKCCHFLLPKAIWCGQKIKKNKKKIRSRKVEWLFQGPTAYWDLKTVFQRQVQGILNRHITGLWHKDLRPTLDSSSLVFSAWACFNSLSISSIRAIFEVLALKKTQKPFKNTASYWCLIRCTHTHTPRSNMKWCCLQESLVWWGKSLQL